MSNKVLFREDKNPEAALTALPSNAEAAPSQAPAAAEEAAAQGIVVTEAAAREIQRQRAKRGTPEAAIRIGLRGGGCTGYSYVFDWVDGEPRAKDHVIDQHGVRIYIDPKSFKLLAGTVLDFVTSMMGHGFKFENPNVTGTCGCGVSVQF